VLVRRKRLDRQRAAFQPAGSMVRTEPGMQHLLRSRPLRAFRGRRCAACRCAVRSSRSIGTPRR